MKYSQRFLGTLVGFLYPSKANYVNRSKEFIVWQCSHPHTETHRHVPCCISNFAGTATTCTVVTFPATCFSLNLMPAIHFILSLAPQVWVDRTVEVSSQHASRTASQGHCAHNRLDPGFGSASRSTGKCAPSKFLLNAAAQGIFITHY